jgi:hypothetical protein
VHTPEKLLLQSDLQIEYLRNAMVFSFWVLLGMGMRSLDKSTVMGGAKFAQVCEGLRRNSLSVPV